MPGQLEKLIRFLQEGSKTFEQQTGDAIDVSDVISVLEEMRDAFTESIKVSGRGMTLKHTERGYEISITPIRNFLLDHQTLPGDISELKKRMVNLVFSDNIGLFKQNYTFLDDLSIILEESN
ncbi:hypothetical protein DN752_17685 [Echinicola strongylocentroti]|uniref:Uncharacterized protein n=2 Tax=Echinicola strongylocentroti TaxID=1795355 RepID=A0A2Z4IN58_9BACT|nr:hypothetical protein DN752_17685 [Echinicola strongylocentroti]